MIPALNLEGFIQGDDTVRGQLVAIQGKESGLSFFIRICHLTLGAFRLRLSRASIFPLLQLNEQRFERGQSKNDDQIAADIADSQMKTGMNNQSVLQALILNGNGSKDCLHGFNLEGWDCKGDLNFQKVAERAEAGVQNDIANLSDNLARRAVESDCAWTVCEDFVEEKGGISVKKKDGVAGDGTGKNLVDAGNFALDHFLQFFNDFGT